jgi:hypothetical protein
MITREADYEEDRMAANASAVLYRLYCIIFKKLIILPILATETAQSHRAHRGGSPELSDHLA